VKSKGRVDPHRELLHTLTARYVRVLPGGLEIDGYPQPKNPIDAVIIGHGGARTLYRARHPVCRSLDGVRALKDPDKTCIDCPERGSCTPQVRVDLLHEGLPFRMLLAYTSGKNFLLYAGASSHSGYLSAIKTRIRVVDRGSWGEVTFEEIGPS
jgi:hypothetical protein